MLRGMGETYGGPVSETLEAGNTAAVGWAPEAAKAPSAEAGTRCASRGVCMSPWNVVIMNLLIGYATYPTRPRTCPTSPDGPDLLDRSAERAVRRRDRMGEARCQYRRLWCTGEQQLFADGPAAVVAHPPGWRALRFRLDGQRRVFGMGTPG